VGSFNDWEWQNLHADEASPRRAASFAQAALRIVFNDEALWIMMILQSVNPSR
jgi:hypothetical protein